jgi:hypothetical protein
VLGTTDNCGTCGHRCSGRNATWSCVAGECTFAGCLDGFDNCNHSVADGCEAVLASDGDNCGMCGNQCLLGLGLICVGGSCVLGL